MVNPLCYNGGVLLWLQAQFMEERTRLHNLLGQKREEYDCLKQLQTNEIISYQEKLAQIEQVCNHMTITQTIVLSHDLSYDV